MEVVTTSPALPGRSNVNTNSNPTAVRLSSVDIYRGLVMLLMMAEVLSIHRVSEAMPANNFWSFLAFHQSHVEWTGASLHDMIQPSFTFLVGVVLPYSIAGRRRKGSDFSSLLRHTITRSLILVLLGIFLRSMYSKQTNFTFEDTLTQIGLGYTFLFLLFFCSTRVQVITFSLLIAGYWLLFALHPLPGPDFDYASAGVPPDWEHQLRGFAAHWNMNTNFAWWWDRWFLNLFPREKPFEYNSGGYTTLSFIPTLGTMILGLFAGKVLIANSTSTSKIQTFLKLSTLLLALSLLLHFTGINPIVKRIWTPAWTLFSGSVCFLFLCFFYYVVDIKNYKRWGYFLLVIGANSIAAYVLADAVAPFFRNSLYIHLGQEYDKLFASEYASLVRGSCILMIEWLILYWMYRKKIFIKI